MEGMGYVWMGLGIEQGMIPEGSDGWRYGGALIDGVLRAPGLFTLK